MKLMTSINSFQILLNQVKASSVEIAFFEIYNERIHDLLADEPKPPKMKREPFRDFAQK